MLICSAIEFHLADNFFTLIGYSVTGGVFQSPEIWCGDDVECSIVPETALGHGHPVGKNSALVEKSISVGVGEAANETRQFLLDFLASSKVATIAFSYIEMPLIIKARHHGVFQEWRSCREADLKSIPDLERWGSKGFVCQNRGECPPEEECDCHQGTRRCGFLPLACAEDGW